MSKTNLENPLTLELIKKDGLLYSSDDSSIAIKGTDALQVTDGWAEIGGRQHLDIDRSHDELFNLSAFNYEMTLDTEADSSGRFLHQHNTLSALIDKDGFVQVDLITGEGRFALTSDTALFEGGAQHHINLVYDGAGQTLSIYADGVEVGSVFAEGTTAPREFWGLTIGDTWHDAVDANVQNIKLSSEAASPQQVLEAYKDMTGGDLKAVAQVETSASDKSVVTLDAGLSSVPEGDAAEYLWSFADGTTQSGRVVDYDFGTAGVHEYTLTVTTPDGREDTISRTLTIENPLTLELIKKDGLLYSSDDSSIAIKGTDALQVTDGWAEIGGRQHLDIDRSHDELFNLSAFNYEMTLDTEADSSGRFLHQHNTLSALIDKDGFVQVDLITGEGRFALTSDTALFEGGAQHHINLVYDGAGQTLSIYADGVEVGSVFAEGTTAPREFWGLTIGDTWHDAVDANVQNIKLSSEAASPQQVLEAYKDMTGGDLKADNEITVSTQDELDAAFAKLSAEDGGTILLEAGTSYSVVFSDWQDKNEDAQVVIRSADIENRATIQEIRLSDRENITIEDTIMHATRDDLPTYQPMITITGAENITLRNNEMSSNGTGPAGTDEGNPSGASLGSIRNSDGVSFEGNTISGFMHGLTLRDTYETHITGNDFSGLQGDGIRLGGASGVVIEDNYFHDFFGTPWASNHPDVIQLWGTNIKVNNENIQIRENVLDMSGAAAYQMIFGHNEDREINGLQFTNITIEHNVLYGAHEHMISLSDTLNATVNNNTAIYSQDSYFVSTDGTKSTSQMTGRITIEGDNAIVENNIGHSIDSNLVNATLTIGDARNDSDYTNHFINIEAGGSGDLRDITLVPDSELNGVMGSHLTWYNADKTDLKAVAQVETSASDKSVVTLDAGLSSVPEGDAAEYLWSFADGTTQSGRVVDYDFGTAGVHEYTLTVTTPDGREDTISRTLTIENPLTLELIKKDGLLYSSDDSSIAIKGTDALQVTDGWAEIGGRQHLDIDRSHDELFNLSAFNYEMTLDTEADSSGRFLHQHNTLSALIDKDGFVQVDLITGEGRFALTSDTALFEGGAQHHINLVYDGAGQTLSIYADGVEVGSVFAEGTTAPREFWGLTIGDTWHDAVDANVQNIKLSSEAASPQQVLEAYKDMTGGDLKADNDTFVFVAQSDSELGSGDIIIDGINGIGHVGGDIIDLSAIDANTTLDGNDSFTFLGELTTAQGMAQGAGSLWVENVGDQTKVYGLTDNDNTIDFAIWVNDGVAISASDYITDNFLL